jgi:hypothetical protein
MNIAQKKEFGDFQTPAELAAEVCRFLHLSGVRPKTIIEPTCGIGNFARESLAVWANASDVLGFDVNEDYVRTAREKTPDARAGFEKADFFAHNWGELLSELPKPILILGNLPWVTNAEIGALGGSNLPEKKNSQGHSGFDAISGKANFDISEWMLMRMLDWCELHAVTVALLVKVSVARKVLRQAWEKRRKIGDAAIYRIDAKRWFGAAVDACLFVMSGEKQSDPLSPVFSSIGGALETTIGYKAGELVGDVKRYDEVSALLGSSPLRWRSGVKHDCSKVMEFTQTNGEVRNGLGEKVDLEPHFLFPLFKSSQLARGDTTTDRLMLVTQRRVGEPTNGIRHFAPKTWAYLEEHASALDPRASTIYKKGPRFAVFGVGEYTFAPFKVAISGLYKLPLFVVLGPIDGKPVVVDDTACFLSFERREEANAVARALNSPRSRAFFSVFAFIDSKRPFTVEVLSKLNLARLVQEVVGGDTAFLKPPVQEQGELLAIGAGDFTR